MVLCGKVNKDLVTLLEKAGGRGIGLGGMDGGLFQAKRLTDRAGTDYGYVGDIMDVDPAPVIDVLQQGYIPVVSTVAQGIDDETNYNICLLYTSQHMQSWRRSPSTRKPRTTRIRLLSSSASWFTTASGTRRCARRSLHSSIPRRKPLLATLS